MTASEIDAFLNSFPKSCISTKKGFKAPEPIGYSPTASFTYGNDVSAGTIIYDAAKVYGLNPQVLLVTIQKEQGYVIGPGTYDCTNPLSTSARKGYSGVMGYGCPDGGSTYDWKTGELYSINGTKVTTVDNTCVKKRSYVGFSRQVINAAWLLKFGQQRSLGNTSWNVQMSNFPHSGNVWDNSDDPNSCYSGPMTEGNRKRCSGDTPTFFDGYTTIDSSSLHMDTGATATLYWYTPHKHGNENFVTFFNEWFGSTLSNPFKVSIADDKSSEAGGTARVKFYLASQPSGNVTIPLSVSDTSEGSLSSNSITITPSSWNSPNTNQVTITGVDDSIPDGDVGYLLITHTPSSSDPAYGNLTDKDVPNTQLYNTDNDPYLPLAGDWNEDGRDTISMRRGYANLINNGFDGHTDFVFNYGSYQSNYTTNNAILVGDWNGDGKDELGYKIGNYYYLNTGLDSKTDIVYQYGQPGDTPLIGDWNKDGRDTVSVRRNYTNYINNGFDGSTDFSYNYGDGTETALVGDWNKDGRDTIALRKGYANRINNGFDGSTDFSYNYGL
jgi:hypothetical protein